MIQEAYETASTADRDIVVTRLFDAPRELVFDAFTDEQHIGAWWGPKGFAVTTFEMDVRPGGVWRFVMHGPDGTDYQNKIVYVDVDRPSRLVYDHVTGPLFRSTVTFAEEKGKTSVTVRMLFESAELRDRVARDYGAVEGLQQTLGRLADHLAGGDMRITRLFDAPRAMVFDAWTDPKQMAQWWGPHHFTNPLCEIDARPGGAIRIDMRGPDGVAVRNEGVFREVVKPERLVFTLNNSFIDTVITVTFAEKGGKTELTVQSHVVRLAPEAVQARAGMEAGWTQSLVRLEALLHSP